MASGAIGKQPQSRSIHGAKKLYAGSKMTIIQIIQDSYHGLYSAVPGGVKIFELWG